MNISVFYPKKSISTSSIFQRQPNIPTLPSFPLLHSTIYLRRGDDMAVALGAVPLLLDVISSRIIIPDRKPRPLPSTSTSPTDVVLNLPKRDPHPHPHHHHHHHHHVANTYASIAANSSSESFEKVNRKSDRVIARGMSNSESNDVDFDFDEGEDEVNGSDEDDESRIIWEKTMRKRMKEIEEMKELEKKAEELQSRMEADGDDNGGGDETEEEKRIRVRKELEKVAKEQAERRASANLMFEVGQKAYGRGMYGRSIEFFEGALTIIPKPTLFGGEIQIWLAMAYEANNRHADCITLYKQLEQKHPCVTIRRQAAELRYILQAPKLKISQEEMVTIPLIGSSYDSYAGTWTDKYKDKDERLSGSTTNQLPSSKDYVGDFMVWKPPVELEKNRAFWVTVTLWLGLVGAAVFLQR